ncbi:MAG: diadenylate cyclase CdaA [Bacteroidales bacterium]|nr:diadenylate cyclase CdaA [Bacteroidales bacterium]
MPEALSFINFRIVDILDILIVAVLLYELYKLTKGTAAVKLFWLVAIFYIVWKVIAYFQFTILSELMGELINVGILAIIILFAPEIRKFLLYIGDGRLLRFFSDKFGKQEKSSAYSEEVEAVCDACRHMSKSMTGALIVFARKTPLDEFLNSGKTIDALPTAELLENIFFKNSPLHDGAVIIKDHRVAAARCILPVSKSTNLPQGTGLRHRSALGSTELTDALAVVVSEQTGTISLCKNGQIVRELTASGLRQLLLENLTKEN